MFAYLRVYIQKVLSNPFDSSATCCPNCCFLQHEHKELLNRTHAGARCSGAGDSSDCLHGSSPLAGSSSSAGSPAAAGALTSRSGAAALAGADPAAALHRMHTNLQALKVRKQRVTGSTPLSDLQQQAESASERLLLAKLQEAGRIMEEQETVRVRWRLLCSCACPNSTLVGICALW